MTLKARQLEYQVVHCLRVDVAFDTPGISSGLLVGYLPPHTVLLDVWYKVSTTFNAGTTNVLTVGTTATANEILDAATAGSSISEAAGAPAKVVPLSTFNPLIETKTPIYVKFDQTGTAATQGAATLVMNYLPNSPAFTPSNL